MRPLLWKEWHEQSWKLGFGCIVLGTLAALAFRSRLLSDETTSLWICYIGLTLLPILASTGLIPAERGDGTLEMLLSLPLRRSRLLAVKLISGIGLVAVPMLTALAVALLMTRGREMDTAAMAGIYLRSVAAAVMLLLWMVAATVRLPTEARAGLIAVGLLIIWELLTALFGEFAVRTWDHAALEPKPFRWLLSLSPLSFVFGIDDIYLVWPPLSVTIVCQAVTAAALWVLAVVQLRGGDATA